MPQEIEVWYVLPAIRAQLARAMLKRGLTQTEAAKKMGLTKAAVSQYLKRKRANSIKFSQKINRAIQKSADEIISGKNILSQIQKLCSLVKSEIGLCNISKSLGLAPKNCRECFK